MAEFTKGTWKSNGTLVEVSGEEIARTWTCVSGVPESEANARLIAAAPDLFEALSELLDSIESAGGCDENGDAFDITKAMAALDKAEGKR